MEAPIVGGVFSLVLNKLYDFADGRRTGFCNIETDMKDIQEKMVMIDSVLENAEERALRERPIHLWLKRLRVIMREIEDLVDDYVYESNRLKNAPFYKKHKKLSLRMDFVQRIKDINERLDKIYKNKKQFCLDAYERDVDGRRKENRVVRKAAATAFKVVGEKIQGDTEQLLKLIMKKNTDEEKVTTIAITGMGGVGKTTLAQNVFSRIKGMGKSFDIICWVSVTKECDETTLLEDMLVSIDPEGNKGIHSKVKLVENLESILGGDNSPKRFFFVLDDMWSGEYYDLLNASFHRGAAGSKVIITTRDVTVAMKMHASYLLRVDVLSQQDALSLLYQNVFGNRHNREDEEDMELLEHIAKDIVEKCGYLPLAIMAIGGVLRTKGRREIDWNDVLKKYVWDLREIKDTVMCSLYLSYMDIEPIYRQCFLYLSLFPSKIHFSMGSIVCLWTGENLVEQDKGEECYKSLVQRNLLQNTAKDPEFHIMHDLVHSFIRGLSKEEHSYGEVDDKSQQTSVFRYSIYNAKATDISSNVKNYKNLRSLVLVDCPHVISLPRKDILKMLRYLRVLYLTRAGIKVLPDYVRKLIHLRLLDLSETPIESLPETMGDLVNLRYLGLLKCESLNVLPKSLTKLKNLRYLGTTHWRIRDIPKGLDGLTQLETLRGCVDIKELGPLVKLREVHIPSVEGKEAEEAERAKLKEKACLRELVFTCVSDETITAGKYNQDEVAKQDSVLEALRPPPCVEHIIFIKFLGLQMPSWLSSQLQNLTNLDLQILVHCQRLPGLGELPYLQKLSIQLALEVRTVGLEFFYRDQNQRQANARPFRKLIVLKLERMDALEECQWLDGSTTYDIEEAVGMPFPRMEELFLKNCHKLVSLWTCLHAATSLTCVDIENCCRLEVIPELPAVKKILVKNCMTVKYAGPFLSLETVYWEDISPRRTCIPEWLGMLHSGNAPSAPSLQRLFILIRNPYIIRRLCPVDIAVDWPLINKIPSVTANAIHEFRTGDSFNYEKSPFLIQHRIGYVGFSSNGRSKLPKFPTIHFAASCHRGHTTEDSSSSTDRLNPGVTAIQSERQVTPATISGPRGLNRIAVSVFPPKNKDCIVRLSGDLTVPKKLPSNYHAHLEVITTDGERQLVCIDQDRFSTQTGFVTMNPNHYHLPYTTTTGEPIMACFSEGR